MPFLQLYDEAKADFRADVLAHRLKEWDDNGIQQLQRFLESRGDPREARTSAIELQHDAGRKYGGISIGDKTVISKKWVDTIVGNISNAIAVGDKLMASAPETVSAAWFVVKLGLNAIQSDYALYGVFGDGLTVVTEVMILIPHYDEMFDRRDKAGYKIDSMTDELFKDIKRAYVAVLDFMFSVQRHIEATNAAKFRHALKAVLGGQAKKFQGKQDAITSAKAKVLQSSDAAFKRNVFDNMDDIQSQLKVNLDQMANNQKELIDSLQDLKANLKPKSTWDFAKQDFEERVKILEPYRTDQDIITSLKEKRLEGTGMWLFETDEYRKWLDGSSKRLLCLTGSEGTGKSVLAVAALSQLSGTLKSEDNILTYFSCTKKDHDLADFGEDKMKKIRCTLMYQVYKALAEDEFSESPGLLDEANRLFQRPKTKKEEKGMTESSEIFIPQFVQTMVDLSRIIKRKPVLLIDGVDRLPAQDQSALFTDLSALATAVDCRIMAVCRTDKDFLHDARLSALLLDIEVQNKADAEKVLDAVVSTQQELTAAERLEAKERVMKKAGSSFAYVTEVAIPFLKEPFQRPLSKRLDNLPEGILDTYKQSLQLMQPAYADLLKTALTWTLYSRQPVTVMEILEAHSGIYTAPFEKTSEDTLQSYQPAWQLTDAEAKQIEAASGPFLRTWIGELELRYCSPRDMLQMRQFCEPVKQLQHTDHEHHLCANCGKDIQTSASLNLTEKEVHLALVLTALRHINSPLFQRRFGLFYETYWFPAAEGAEDDGQMRLITDDDMKAHNRRALTRANTNLSVHDTAESGAESTVASNEIEAAEVIDPTKAAESVKEEETIVATLEDNQQSIQEAIPEQANGTTSIAEEKTEDETAVEDDDDDKSVDSEDGDDDDDRDDLPTYDGPVYRRYEIEQWPYHLREAEKWWTPEERSQSPEWKEVFELLSEFAESENLVHNWQRSSSYEEHDKETMRFAYYHPLNLAARLGLQSWAEYLIKEEELDPNEVNDETVAILAIKPAEENRELLKFFLQQPGLDPDVLSGSDKWDDPVVHLWLRMEGSAETIQLLRDAGADFTRAVGENKRTAMQALAWGSEDMKALDLLLSSPNPPDINAARPSDKQTALHFLTMRSNLTVEMLQAYLKAGANVDAENEYSVRPLHQACWSNQPAIVRAILEHGVAEIDDDDNAGDTALHAACYEKSLECVQALIKHGANINVKSKAGRTPFHAAAWTSNTLILQELIDAGAEINLKDGHNRTPFWFACYCKDGPDKALLLLDALKKAGVPIQDINGPSKSKRTPLRFAANHGYAEVVKQLVDMTQAAGLDVKEMLDMQDELKKTTALHRAALRGEAECVKILIDAGASATLLDKSDNTPMQLAQEQWQALGSAKHEEVVLLLAPKDIKRVMDDFDLPAIAATNGSVKVLEKLASLGINLNNADSFGWTPLLLAQRLGITEVEKFLRSHAAWRANLPSRWVTHAGAEEFTLDESGTAIVYTKDKRFSITTDRPLPGNLDRYYYEITLSRPVPDKPDDEANKGFDDTPEIAIAFSNLGGIAYRFPGWEAKQGVRNGKSWAYHGDDGWLGSSEVRDGYPQGEQYGPGDTIGAGIDLGTQTIWFTKNGVKLDFEHKDVSGRLFPMLGLVDKVCVSTNFGDKKMRWEKWNEETGNANGSAGVDAITNGLHEVKLGATNGV